MTLLPKKHKSPAPVLSNEALLTMKQDAFQEGETKITQLNQSHEDLLRQRSDLQRDHQRSLIAHGRNEAGADDARTATELQMAQVERKITAVEAARAHQKLIHAELAREMSALQQEVSQRKYQEYVAGLEAGVKEKKEQLIANLYAGCGLFAELVELADEACLADESPTLAGYSHVSNAGHRFVEEALQDLNLRTTPIIMMERAGFSAVRSSLALAQRAYEVRALAPPKKN